MYLFTIIVQLCLILLANIMTLTSTVIEKSTFQKIPHMHALGITLDLVVK